MPELNAPSREEIDAKLQAAEARTETRIATLSGGIDLKFAHLESKLDVLIGAVREAKSEQASLKSEVRADAKDVKANNKATSWIITTIVLAALGVMYATQANYISSFTAGIAAFQVKNDQGKDAPKIEVPKSEVAKDGAKK